MTEDELIAALESASVGSDELSALLAGLMMLGPWASSDDVSSAKMFYAKQLNECAIVVNGNGSDVSISGTLAAGNYDYGVCANNGARIDDNHLSADWTFMSYPNKFIITK